MKRSSRKKKKFVVVIKETNDFDEINNFFRNKLLDQNWDLREVHETSFNEMEELKRFQGSTFDTIARRKLVEVRNIILEIIGKIQELQNEISCMNDSREFQDVEPVRSGNSHVASQFFLSHLSSWWDAKPFSGNVEPQRRTVMHLGHTW